jgi:hypothetical protein
MGRAKILSTEPKESSIALSVALVKYSIPVGEEAPELGKFLRSEIKNGFINIYYERIIKESEDIASFIVSLK